MLVQIRFQCKCFMASLAFEILISRMCLHVCTQIRAIGKCCIDEMDGGERGKTKRKSKKFKQRNALVKMDTHFIKRNNEHNSKTNTNKKAHHIDNSIECKFSDGQSDECLNRKFENRKKNNETNGIIGCNVAITFPAVCTSVRFFARM